MSKKTYAVVEQPGTTREKVVATGLSFKAAFGMLKQYAPDEDAQVMLELPDGSLTSEY